MAKVPTTIGAMKVLAAMPRRQQQSARSKLKTSAVEEVEVVGLGVGDLRVCSQHLRSSGRESREKGHLGPRHAIREARVRTTRPSVATWPAGASCETNRKVRNLLLIARQRRQR